MSLKLRALSPDLIGPILQQEPSCLFWAMVMSQSHPEVMLSFTQLIPYMEPVGLARALEYEDAEGRSMLSIALSRMSRGHADTAHNLLNIIATLPRHEQISVLRLNAPKNSNNPLLMAIMHCPSTIPLILNFTLTLDHDSRTRITAEYLCTDLLHNKKRLCIRRLLELNQRVNALEVQPDQEKAYKAAKRLQSTLIESFNDYFKNSDHPNAFPVLKEKWKEAILLASDDLGNLYDWSTLLKNILLALVSIPLLGIPLAINYYCSGYKHVFFQPEPTRELEHLEELISHESSFSNAISVPL